MYDQTLPTQTKMIVQANAQNIKNPRFTITVQAQEEGVN
jgi:hypothetical protein